MGSYLGPSQSSRLEVVYLETCSGHYAYSRQPCEASATGEGGGGPASYRYPQHAARVWGSSAGRRMIGRGQPQTPNRCVPRRHGTQGWDLVPTIPFPSKPLLRERSPESVQLRVVAATLVEVRRGVLRAPMRVCSRRTTRPIEKGGDVMMPCGMAGMA